MKNCFGQGMTLSSANSINWGRLAPQIAYYISAYCDMVARGEMLEHAEVFGNFYGTPRGPVEAAMGAGRDTLFDVDWQGGQQIRASGLGGHVVSIFVLPPSLAENGQGFVFLSSVLSYFVDELFPGMEVKGAYQFRVTRNSELIVDEEEVENLASALRDELVGRGYRPAVRLEITETGIDSISEPTIGTSHHRKLGFSHNTTQVHAAPNRVCGP